MQSLHARRVLSKSLISDCGTVDHAQRTMEPNATGVLSRTGSLTSHCPALPRPRVSRLVGAEVCQFLLNLVCGSLCLGIGIGTDLDSYLAMAVCCGVAHNIVSLGTGRGFAIRDQTHQFDIQALFAEKTTRWQERRHRS